ncbi:MAG: gamma-glutamyltransferase family protein [Burkholderiales bacterium]|nr:gamma-glutamyltransferase family protein [Burkholderiales bacterium]
MSFDYARPYPSARSPLMARHAVATSHPLAAQAGVATLRAGGSAIDAAIATAAALTVLEPTGNGLGSDLFALVWSPEDDALAGLNSSGRSPQAWTAETFHGLREMPALGWMSVSVPGMVAGWVTLWKRWGKLPFAQLLAPAIEYAERGFAVPPIIAMQWARAVPRLRDQPGFAEHFMPGGRAPHAGEVFRNPAQAETLRLIAESEGESFYRGQLAARIVAHAKAHGGMMTGIDLAAHSADWVEPIRIGYRGYEIAEIPPNGQGIAALMALGMLEPFDLAALGPQHPDYWHLSMEAMKLAFRDVHAQVADPAHMRVSPSELLDRDFLRRRAALIDPKRAQDFSPSAELRGGTVYLTAGDERGMMVSLIQSNYNGFGSGVVVDGIAMQNRARDFSLDPAHPNHVAGGKRPFHTIIPGFILKDGRAQAAFGVMGGHVQPQGHLQTAIRLIDFHENPQAALDAPRFRVESGLEVNLEPWAGDALRAALAERGHRFKPFAGTEMDFGCGQILWREGDGYIVGSDPRRDGTAAGY